jgi:predicted Zn-dependent peptidase
MAVQIARAVMQLVLYELPDDSFSQFLPRVARVDTGTVTRVAAAHLDPARLLTVIVGDRDKVTPALDRLGLGTPVEVPLP